MKQVDSISLKATPTAWLENKHNGGCVRQVVRSRCIDTEKWVKCS